VTVYRNYKRVFMYIDDFIPTLARTCERFEPGGTYNIGGREYRSVEDLMNIVIENVPDYPRTLIAWKDREEMNVANKRPLIEKAVAAFGHDPRTPLEVGVPRTIAWMREVHGVK
jgi:dTDP-glucose 4,6-dehydratase